MRTIEQIAEAIDPSTLPEYRRQLVYVHGNDDGLDPTTVETLLRDGYDDGVDEWINERQWESACDLADELFKDECEPPEDDDSESEFATHELEWGPSHERYDLIQSIMELDTSDTYGDLLRVTNNMLFRVQPGEDDMVFLDAETLDGPAVGVCEALGLPLAYLEAVDEILPEVAGYAAEGGGWFMPVYVFRANPADLYGHADDDLIEIAEPFLWLTNPWSGNGYGVVLEGQSVVVKMSDIHTDKAAWGYGADDVFGGLILDDSDITLTTKEAE